MVYATVVPELDERDLEKTVNPIVQEYFEHGDTREVQVGPLPEKRKEIKAKLYSVAYA